MRRIYAQNMLITCSLFGTYCPPLPNDAASLTCRDPTKRILLRERTATHTPRIQSDAQTQNAMHERDDKQPQRLPRHGCCEMQDLPRIHYRLLKLLSHPWTQPGSFQTPFVELSLPVLTLDAEAHTAQLSGIPSTDKFALAAVLPVDGVAKLYEVGLSAHGLRVRPL
jgi:hypothetical protein